MIVDGKAITKEIKEELKIDALYTGLSLDGSVETVLIGAMNVRDARKFIQRHTLMIIPGDREDMIDAMARLVSGIIISGGIMPRRGCLKRLERTRIPVLITKEDTYRIASRVHSMIVKLKPQDTQKIRIIVDMVEKHLDIDKVLASLK